MNVLLGVGKLPNLLLVLSIFSIRRFISLSKVYMAYFVPLKRFPFLFIQNASFKRMTSWSIFAFSPPSLESNRKPNCLGSEVGL